ncbi:hypothetical protein LCGC14_1538390 [marine sediment metagenome]|uniref:Uncharacterized protein n=1 Tax=marine sediment metagenome TaxID=412755 RepID=A0A0F9L9T6_9ZZZZ
MNRDRLLLELKELWDRHPEQRFGQLLFNYTRFGTRAGLGMVVDPFHFQDKSIIQDLINAKKDGEKTT